MGTSQPRFGLQKLAKSRGIEEIPPRMPLTLETKTKKSSPFAHEFGTGIKGKRTMKGSSIHPPNKSQRERPRIHHKEFAKKGLRKSPKRRNTKDTSKPSGTTSNHLYIQMRFIQGLACHPIILPSHKISP
jgi:hypothetical protein